VYARHVEAERVEVGADWPAELAIVVDHQEPRAAVAV